MDLAEENLIQHFDDTYDFIHNTYENNGKILVHCEAGVSRSVSVMAAYLMRSLKITPKAALDIIRDHRVFAQPNDGFMDQLELYHTLQYDVDPKHAAYRRFLVVGMAKEQQGDYAPQWLFEKLIFWCL